MLDKKEMKEIKEMENTGIKVTAISSDGTIAYATESGDESKYCDKCKSLRLLPDPDPTDWFRDTDKKAVCLEVNAVIAGALDPWEQENICKPLYCPKLGRKLTDEEQKEASNNLSYAQSLMKKDET